MKHATPLKITAQYSGKQVIQAGERLLRKDILNDQNALNAALDVVSYWRFSHETALENALNLLKATTLQIDKKAIFAKRLKRFISIFRKLHRFPEMKLKNMQDIGGCRAIVANPKKLKKVVRKLRERPEFRNGNGAIRYKDYISSPKEDGYRGYHLIGQFSNGLAGKRNIELQIRTRLQHDWATTLEIVDLFTGQALKSNQGEHDWKEFFSNVSRQFALMEEIHLFDTLPIAEKFKKYSDLLMQADSEIKASCATVQKVERKLNVATHLEAYSNTLKIVDGRISEDAIDGYALIVVDVESATVTTSLFNKNENEEAEKRYALEEKQAAGNKNLVVALVSTTAVGGIKEAYPNYFADSKDFVEHLILITEIKLPHSIGILSLLQQFK
jgi:ppGpp synthetase/RelA/SpoT-type nucleotidyltranferase